MLKLQRLASLLEASAGLHVSDRNTKKLKGRPCLQGQREVPRERYTVMPMC